MSIRKLAEELEALTDEYITVLQLYDSMGKWGDRDKNYAGSIYESSEYMTGQIKKTLGEILEKLYEESK